MTVKLVVLYTQPDDAEAFDKHYFDTHMPLVDAMPGVERVETGKFSAALDGGEQAFYRYAELYFADDAAMSGAFGSAEGQATAADYGAIAPPGSRMFLANVD
ncbi:MAG TPA: EthD family reductase [Streptosporangiaceae bacterium]|nr:EthD family reductase [Streptosporangiaceae bacterium]